MENDDETKRVIAFPLSHTYVPILNTFQRITGTQHQATRGFQHQATIGFQHQATKGFQHQATKLQTQDTIMSL